MTLCLKVNFKESRFRAFGIIYTMVKHIIDKLNCGVIYFPLTYLGLLKVLTKERKLLRNVLWIKLKRNLEVGRESWCCMLKDYML